MPVIGISGSATIMSPALDAMRSAVEIGYDAFEIYADFPQCVCDDMTPDQREESRSIVEVSGMTLSLHAPFTSLNIAALNNGIRDESVRQTIAAIDLCADMGGKSVTVHNGGFIMSSSLREKTPEASNLQMYYNIESLKRAAGRAEERGVNLCLENIGFEPNSVDRCVEDMLKIRKEVNSDAMFFCIDIGHARLNGELDDAIEKMGPFARQIHFTDNFGENDDHLTIGEGNFDYTPHLDFFRNFEHVIILEVIKIGTDPEPAKKSLEYVKKLFGPSAP